MPRVGPARVKEIIRLTHVLSPPICLGHQIHWDNLCSRVAQEMVFWLPRLELLFMVWSFLPSVPKNGAVGKVSLMNAVLFRPPKYPEIKSHLSVAKRYLNMARITWHDVEGNITLLVSVVKD